MLGQRFLCQEDCADNDVCHPAEKLVQDASKRKRAKGERQHHGTPLNAACGSGVEPFIHRPDQPSHEDRRVRGTVPECLGFAKDGVENHGDHEGQNADSSCSQRSGAGRPRRSQLSA